MVFLQLRKEQHYISPHWLPINWKLFQQILLYITERDLSRFDREAQVAKSRNTWFKAKNFQNNMVRYRAKSEIKVDEISKKLKSSISAREMEPKPTREAEAKIGGEIEEKCKG